MDKQYLKKEITLKGLNGAISGKIVLFLNHGFHIETIQISGGKKIISNNSVTHLLNLSIEDELLSSREINPKELLGELHESEKGLRLVMDARVNNNVKDDFRLQLKDLGYE